MNAIKKFKFEDIWAPPIGRSPQLNLTGNEVIDEFGRQVRLRPVEYLWYYAENMDLTTEVLNKTMKAFMGYPANKYKDYILLFDAQWYLEYTLLSIKEIAGTLGFKSGGSFYTFFKRMKKTSPSNYRKSVRRVEKKTTYEIIHY